MVVINSSASIANRVLSDDGSRLFEIALQYRAGVPSSISGVVYRATVAHIYTPTNAYATGVVIAVTNLLALGNGGLLYLDPTNGVTIDPPTNNGTISPQIIKIEFGSLLETSNAVNRIFNPTPKDDPPPVSSNKLYVVESPADGQFHVKLSVNTAPASLNSLLMYAVFDNTGSKVTGAEGHFPTSGGADISFAHTGSSTNFLDYEIKVGYDLNTNVTLDTNEVFPVRVRDSSGYGKGAPTVRGIVASAYDDDVSDLNWLFDTPWLVLPNASALLHIFMDGDTHSIYSSRLPTSTNAITFNCFTDPYAIWLTHNAGAAFTNTGNAEIKLYTWGTNTLMADMVCKSGTMEVPVQVFFSNTVLAAATAYFATNAVGTVTNFPLDGTMYDIPHADESQQWTTNYLSGVTVTFYQTIGTTSTVDDVNHSIGRGRVLTHKARFTIQTYLDFWGSIKTNTITHFSGAVEDLYDFNAEDKGPGGEAAVIQLGHGNGCYSTGRIQGQIFRNRIEFDQDVVIPFN